MSFVRHECEQKERGGFEGGKKDCVDHVYFVLLYSRMENRNCILSLQKGLGCGHGLLTTGLELLRGLRESTSKSCEYPA